MLDLSKYLIAEESHLTLEECIAYEQLACTLEVEELTNIATEAANSESTDSPNGSNGRKAIKKKMNAIKAGDKKEAAVADREYKSSIENIKKDAKSGKPERINKAIRALKIIGATILGLGAVAGTVAAVKASKKAKNLSTQLEQKDKKLTQTTNELNKAQGDLTRTKDNLEKTQWRLSKTIDGADLYRNTVAREKEEKESIIREKEEMKREFESTIQEISKDLEQKNKALLSKDNELTEVYQKLEKAKNDYRGVSNRDATNHSVLNEVRTNAELNNIHLLMSNGMDHNTAYDIVCGDKETPNLDEMLSKNDMYQYKGNQKTIAEIDRIRQVFRDKPKMFGFMG